MAASDELIANCPLLLGRVQPIHGLATKINERGLKG